jgi:hypothetical protein
MNSNIKHMHARTHIHTQSLVCIFCTLYRHRAFICYFLHYSLSLNDILSLVLDNWYLCSLFLHSLPSQPFTLNLHIIHQLPPSQPSAQWQSYSIISSPVLTFSFVSFGGFTAYCILFVRTETVSRPTDMIPINSLSQFSDDSTNNLSQQKGRAFLTISLNG